MGRTLIQWAPGAADGREGWTINPFRARWRNEGRLRWQTKPPRGHFCEKISPGCKECYSSRMQTRFRMFPFLAENREKVELYLDEKALQTILKHKKPIGIFWEDMSDMFLDDYPIEWIEECFAVMALTPQHIHMVLTKRPERMQAILAESSKESEFFWAMVEGRAQRRYHERTGEDPALWLAVHGPLPNVYLGVSVENQEYADKRIHPLLRTPAAKRFISLEPLLECVKLFNGGCPHPIQTQKGFVYPPGAISWVIIGGESGPKARPFDLQWARDTREQCRAADVAFFFKQAGRRPMLHVDGVLSAMKLKDSHGGNPDEWPEDLRIRQFPEEVTHGNRG